MKHILFLGFILSVMATGWLLPAVDEVTSAIAHVTD